jgi:2-polyprenyl-3-methyl-5-hydroxy-6-metoxy-1,4-benzoquinol methylase
MAALSDEIPHDACKATDASYDFVILNHVVEHMSNFEDHVFGRRKLNQRS